MQKPRFLLLASIIVLAVSVRVTPYILAKLEMTDVTQFAAFLWNFSPLTALFLFGGAQFAQRRWAYLAPLAAIFVSDVAIGLLLKDMSKGLHPVIPAIYGSYLVVVWLGTLLRKLQTNLSDGTARLAVGSPAPRWQAELLFLLAAAGSGIAGEVVFFAVTNFATWVVQTGYYPHTAAGLIKCYVAGIPFFKHAVVSTPIFTVALFGGCALAESWFPALKQNTFVPADTHPSVVV
jgi:hypothetical protein